MRSCRLNPLVWMVALACSTPEAPLSNAIAADAVVSDARASDATPGRDAEVVDASSDARMSGDATGVVTHDRGVRQGSSLTIQSMPVVGVDVALIVNNSEIERVRTNAQGEYRFASAMREASGAQVRIYAGTDSAGARWSITTDFAGNIYSVLSTPGATHIPQAMNSGAFAIAATLESGLAFARRVLPTTYDWVHGRWERGNDTPRRWTYASWHSRDDDEVFVRSIPTDTDEFDVPVLMHELGHLIQHAHNIDGVPTGGNAHNAENTAPTDAWREGWATFFSGAVARDPIYWDSLENFRVGVNYDISQPRTTRVWRGDPALPLSQNHSEHLVASTLWALLNLHASPPQEGVVFTQLVQRLQAQPDRGATSIDLVDALDAYMCIAPSDRAGVQGLVVTDRTFPYDFGGSCNKPGVRAHDEPIFPHQNVVGDIRIDSHGQRLREVTIASTPMPTVSLPGQTPGRQSVRSW